MNELDKPLELAKRKSYYLSDMSDVRVIEFDDLMKIIDDLKEEIIERYT